MIDVFFLDGPLAGTFGAVSDDAIAVASADTEPLAWYVPTGRREATADIWAVEDATS